MFLFSWKKQIAGEVTVFFFFFSSIWHILVLNFLSSSLINFLQRNCSFWVNKGSAKEVPVVLTTLSSLLFISETCLRWDGFCSYLHIQLPKLFSVLSPTVLHRHCYGHKMSQILYSSHKGNLKYYVEIQWLFRGFRFTVSVRQCS